MNKTASIILKSVLGVLIVFLSVMIFLCVHRPQQREAEYFARRNACGEKLKSIRTLEEAYKTTYGTYCGNWDTMVYQLNQKEQNVVRKKLSPTAPPADSVYNIPELEAIKKGWIVTDIEKVIPLMKLYEDKKLTFIDTNEMKGKSEEQQLAIINEKIKDLIYVPYTHHQTMFTMNADSVAASLSGGGDKLPTFEVYVTLDELFADYANSENGVGFFHKFIETFTGSDQQWLLNKKAELKALGRFEGWKVGDITAPVTEGNFE